MSFVRPKVALITAVSFLLILNAATMVISQTPASSMGRSERSKTDGTIRFGLALPRVSLIGSTGSVTSEAASLRKTVSSYLVGPRIETVTLKARLDSMALEEGQERQCDYVLYLSLTRKRQQTGSRVGGASGSSHAGDEVTFEYKLVSTDGTLRPATNVATARVNADGEDVLAPIIESAAEAIINIARQARPAPSAGTTQTPASHSANIPNPVPSTTSTESGKDSSAGDDALTDSPRRPRTASSVNDLPKAEGAIRIGMALPRVTLLGGGALGSKESLALRETIGSYLAGSTIETIELKARLDSLALDECHKRQCDYVLYTTLVRKRQNSGSRSGGSVGNIIGSLGGAGVAKKVPGGKATQQVSKGAASISGSIAAMAKEKDEVQFEYRLVGIDGQAVMGKSAKAKVKSDGEDVLTPMIETAAQAIVDVTKKN